MNRSNVVRRTSANDEGPRPKKRKSNPPPDEGQYEVPGTIMKLTCRNFMCHEHLTFEFDKNRNTNIITGQNGSGKSAVVAAIMAGLGGRANTTDRGSSLKNLIRTGQRQAVVEILLRNVGSRALLRDKYGDVITVERTIRDSGASSYRLKSANGKVVSTYRKDLITILDELDIQVDNPMAVLTQETSKNFLRTDDPKKKYKLFMSATHLGPVKRSYAEIERKMELTASSIEQKQKTLVTLRENSVKLERQVNLYKNRESIREKISIFERYLQWGKVKEKENELADAEEAKEEKTVAVEQVASKRESWKKKLAELDEKKTELEQRREAVSQEMRQATDLTKTHRAKHRQLVEQLQTAETGKSRTQRALEAEKTQLAHLQQEIERQRSESQSAAAAAEAAQRQAEMARLQELVQERTAAEATQKGHLEHVVETARRQKEEQRQLEHEERAKRSEIDRLARDLSQLQANEGNPRAVFGAWVRDVDAEIEQCRQQNKFRMLPIGPVGAFVRLRAGCEQWAPLVEKCLGPMLKAYLVNDRSDTQLMSAILERCCRQERQKPIVFTSKFSNEMHDVARYGIDPASGHVSVCSVLEIQNPVVFNALVDQSRIETVLLLSSDEEARNLMSHRNRVPRGCAQALTLAGYQYYPDPNYRTYPVNVERHARFLQVSVQDNIGQRRQELEQARHEAQQVTVRLQAALQAARSGGKQEGEARAQLQRTTRQRQQEQARLRELRVQHEESQQPVNMAALEEEMESIKGKIAKLNSTLEELAEKCAKLKTEKKEAEDTYRRSQEDIQSKFSERIETLETETSEVGQKRDKLATALDRSGAVLERKREELASAERAVAEYKAQVKRATAATTGERIESDRPVPKLESRLHGLRKSLEENVTNQLQMTVEEAEAKYKEAEHRHQRIKNEIEHLTEVKEKLTEMLKTRNHRFEILRKSLANRITLHFNTILEQRKFSGKMLFDHQAAKLTMAIKASQPGTSAGGQSSRAPVQLSGGERSFSTLAFVLAMWITMPAPFRVLDEFDVFMDDVARKESYDLLRSDASCSSSQFFFITPLSIPSDSRDPNVSVYKMKPPKRDEH